MRYGRRVIEAALGFLIGAGLLLAGVVINVILIGVAGFMVMLACSMWAATSYRRMTGITTGRVPARDRRAGKQAGSGLMMRLEERWRRRQERRPLNSRLPAAGPRASNAAAHPRWLAASAVAAL